MRAPVMLFAIGCFAIVLIAAYSSSAPGFLLITLIIVFIMWQWHRNSQKLKNSIDQEQKKHRAAGQYIQTLMSPGASRRKKK